MQGLSDAIAKAQRVVLLLAAVDVTLLRVKVPPLSHAKLKAALPNLVEDQLIADPSDSVVVSGGLADGFSPSVGRVNWQARIRSARLRFRCRSCEIFYFMCVNAQYASGARAITTLSMGGLSTV